MICPRPALSQNRCAQPEGPHICHLEHPKSALYNRLKRMPPALAQIPAQSSRNSQELAHLRCKMTITRWHADGPCNCSSMGLLYRILRSCLIMQLSIACPSHKDWCCLIGTVYHTNYPPLSGVSMPLARMESQPAFGPGGIARAAYLIRPGVSCPWQGAIQRQNRQDGSSMTLHAAASGCLPQLLLQPAQSCLCFLKVGLQLKCSPVGVTCLRNLLKNHAWEIVS